MTDRAQPSARIAIACGGTGGHLFPGLAVADQVARYGCAVTLLVSPKEVDQQAVAKVTGMNVVTLPAVGLTRGHGMAFLRGFVRSYRAASQIFRPSPPQVALAMGGFTSAPTILAARRLSARTFLHESNSIAGRANRWLSWAVEQAFIGFASAGSQLRCGRVTVTGTPVRPQIHARPPESCRVTLGLEPSRPVMLVMGGSQGARGINNLVMQALPSLARLQPEWQWIHLTGPSECDEVTHAYASYNLRAIVRPFFDAIELALGAASAAVSRSGASALAELAAMRLPAVLVPYPSAAEQHQFHNALAFQESGAARLLPQQSATGEELVRLLVALVQQREVREPMQRALAQWHAPGAAALIARTMLTSIGVATQGPKEIHGEPPMPSAVRVSSPGPSNCECVSGLVAVRQGFRVSELVHGDGVPWAVYGADSRPEPREVT
jgi:UDP-N-acetylglucosamine--N-acetylmuramyl-(pentapeptide) pyrophosphoryl-undecaprenol N-acetylglucosamine transferase